MGRFRDLQHHLASERLPSVVASTRMSMWSPGDSFPTAGARILIGVAIWSLYDLDMLDALESRSFGDDTVHVFDFNSCKSMTDFDNYIPGIGNVFQPPVVGHWQDGHLLHCEQGAAARNWLLARYPAHS